MIVLNHDAVAHARALVAAGKISHGEWDESKVDRGSNNGSAFLGKDTSMKPEDAGYWKYPVISGGELNRKALGSAEAYAEKNGLTEIASAAKSLGEAADSKNSAAMSALSPQSVHLRAVDFGASKVDVDENAGIIRGAAVMTEGEALGHGFTLDSTSLQQLQALIAANSDGVTVRFKHPDIQSNGKTADTLGTDVGKLKNVRIDGNAVRGDVHLGAWAKSLPSLGNVWDYLLCKAKNDPTGLGLSAAIFYTKEKQQGDALPVARIQQCNFVDFVGKAAANPRGLLSQSTEQINPPASVVGSIPQPPKTGVPKMETTVTTAPAVIPPPVQQAALNDGVASAVAVLSPGAAPVQATPISQTATLSLIETEKARCAQLQSLANVYPGIPATLVNAQIAANASPEQARQAYLGFIAENNKPVTEVQTGTVVVGHDKGIVAHLAAIPDAICIRAGQKVDKPHELADKLKSRRMIDMFKTLMTQLGVSHEEVFDIQPSRMAELLVNPLVLARAYPEMYAQLAQSSSSFSNLLTDAMGKTLRKAYMDTPTTWQEWCGRDTTPDFKSKKFINLSDSPGLTVKSEGKEIVYSTFSDSKETATLVTYASGIKLTREAIINDDLNAFSRIPMAQGGAAKRLEDDTAYAILTANANLADSIALFHASHNNLISATASIGAPTVTTLAATEALLLKQTGPKGAYLKLQARNILVPVALKTVATKLVRSVTDPAATASGVVNPYYNAYNVIAEPRLDATSAVVWYLAADPGIIDTVTMVFLTDEPEPVLKQELVFDTEDAKFAVRHTVVAKAVDFRGLAKNPGA